MTKTDYGAGLMAIELLWRLPVDTNKSKYKQTAELYSCLKLSFEEDLHRLSK